MSPAVVIAGAGPTGLMLAGELALAGVETLVAERLPDPRVAAMGMAINPTVVELLAQRGIMGSLQADGMEWPSAHFAQVWLDPSRLAERHPCNFVLPQAKLERRLAEHAVKLGAVVRLGHRVDDMAPDDTGVTVVLGTADGGTQTVRCQYLVGCDGADSAVRTMAGIEFPGSQPPFYGIVAELEVPLGDPLYQQIGSHQFPAGLFNVTPSEPGVLRVTTGEFEVDPPSRQAPVTVDELRTHVRHVAGVELATGTPRWLRRWYNITRHARHYRRGRVFVAGDAAHVHFPLGGQALSTDLEDAVNLGWKLAAAVHGWAPPGLLDTYHTERHPVGGRACLTTRAQVALLHPLDRVAPVREILSELVQFDDVNEYFVKLVGGLDVRYPMDEPDPAGVKPHPLAGGRLPNAALTAATGPTNTAAILSSGRGILLDLTGGGAAADAAPWADRVGVVAAEPAPEIAASAVLLRPDGRVAWAADAESGNAGLLAALHRWFGAPIRPIPKRSLR